MLDVIGEEYVRRVGSWILTFLHVVIVKSLWSEIGLTVDYLVVPLVVIKVHLHRECAPE
jgi:hypothetical protein